jgi:hypothetical protein
MCLVGRAEEALSPSIFPSRDVFRQIDAPTTSLALPRPLIARVRSRTPSFPLPSFIAPFVVFFTCRCPATYYTCPTYYYYTSLLYFAGALFLLSSKKPRPLTKRENEMSNLFSLASPAASDSPPHLTAALSHKNFLRPQQPTTPQLPPQPPQPLARRPRLSLTLNTIPSPPPIPDPSPIFLSHSYYRPPPPPAFDTIHGLATTGSSHPGAGGVPEGQFGAGQGNPAACHSGILPPAFTLPPAP